MPLFQELTVFFMMINHIHPLTMSGIFWGRRALDGRDISGKHKALQSLTSTKSKINAANLLLLGCELYQGKFFLGVKMEWKKFQDSCNEFQHIFFPFSSNGLPGRDNNAILSNDSHFEMRSFINLNPHSEVATGLFCFIYFHSSLRYDIQMELDKMFLV